MIGSMSALMDQHDIWRYCEMPSGQRMGSASTMTAISRGVIFMVLSIIALTVHGVTCEACFRT